MATRGSCPCQFTTPCKPRCTCINPVSSVGCSRCCTYGSAEQQVARAEKLAKLIDNVEILPCWICGDSGKLHSNYDPLVYLVDSHWVGCINNINRCPAIGRLAFSIEQAIVFWNESGRHKGLDHDFENVSD